ncbi:OTU-domain-containing protein [Lepidopterella palustris CBS 459.81]|uniref:Ubiquitin thioesterase OTU n=1 Tax=Lepidopterella palustris CBS 459.81 TaxID=1314670 RepID=A0A8E2JJ67_9PEZI|nr:OTU-domain-containing protein [Lepidopterella palustris CBS 459.81]
MRIRLRSPAGTSTITLADTATVSDLLSSISEATSLPLFDLKWGFPPRPVDPSLYGLATRLSDTDLKLNGEQLIVIALETGGANIQPSNNISSSKTDAKPALSSQNPSFAGQTNTKRKASDPLTLTRKAASIDSDPPEVVVPSHGSTLVLRVMPDDNSCLFRALGSALLSDVLDGMTELRSVVATAIQDDPETYTAAVLDKAPDDYCRWIQHPDSWGGAIEIGIIARYFGVEVSSINVQDVRVDRFNEGPSRRCILVYSGIHYDVIALSPSDPPHTHSDLSAEDDVKIFDVDDIEVLEAAKKLCRELQKKHYYTDTQRFEILCNDCGWKGHGEKDAVEHAESTGHYNFGEVS